VTAEAKDYIFSTWDDNKLRSFLEERGVIKPRSQAKRDELLRKARDYFHGAADHGAFAFTIASKNANRMTDVGGRKTQFTTLGRTTLFVVGSRAMALSSPSRPRPVTSCWT
jgi:hypothetical protein